MVVVVRTHFLHKSVIYAVEGYIDTDNFEWLGANPGDLALCVVQEAGFRRVISAQGSLLHFAHLLRLHSAVEDL